MSALRSDLLEAQMEPDIMPTNVEGIAHIDHKADGYTEMLPLRYIHI